MNPNNNHFIDHLCPGRILIVAGNASPPEKMGSCLRFNLIPLNWERADFALTIIELMRQEIIVHNNQIKSIPVSEDPEHILAGCRPGLRFWVISDTKVSSLLQRMQNSGAWCPDGKFKKMIKIVDSLAIVEPHFIYYFNCFDNENVVVRDLEVRLQDFLLNREWAHISTAQTDKPSEIKTIANKIDSPEMLVLSGHMFAVDDFGSALFFNLLPIPWTPEEFECATTDILNQELEWYERIKRPVNEDPYDFGAEVLDRPLGFRIWRVSEAKVVSALHYIHSSSKETGMLGAKAKWGLGYIDTLSLRDPDFTYLIDNVDADTKMVLPTLETWLFNHIEST